jgi:hypothetical protein
LAAAREVAEVQREVRDLLAWTAVDGKAMAEVDTMTSQARSVAAALQQSSQTARITGAAAGPPAGPN